jgi:hypothetical protein
LKVYVEEEQRQLILLALAQLSLERPGWHFALGETAKCFPGGFEMYEDFRKVLPVSKVEEHCAKIAEIGRFVARESKDGAR